MQEIDWTQAVAAATRAPSIHNTQPWRFTAGATRLDVFLDPGRALPVLDPEGRQQLISCGMAVAFAEVALGAAGRTVEVGLLPDPGDPDHLARLRVTGPAEPGVDASTLADAIGRRHTVRTAFEPRAVPEDVLDLLQREAGSHGLWCKAITREEEEVATVFLLSQAEEAERHDPAYVAELQSWMREDPAAVDGIPVGAVPAGDPRDRASNWTVRDFAAGSREQRAFRPAQDPAAPPPVVERPTVVLLGTINDDRRSWLEAGRGVGRVLLRATAAGLVASPLTQALDRPATRIRLRQRLSLIGHPQMLLRLGYPSPDLEPVTTGRRPVADVLTIEPT